jgi:predicted DCC family thiol-disulfide oxidoreductase YuxK
MTAAPPPADSAGPVLFFDGACGLCNRIVRVLLRLDGAGGLRFAPLQGSTAQAYLRTHGLPTEDFDTLILVPDWARRERAEYLVRTDGALGALAATGGFGRGLAAVLRIFPAGFRDAGYRLVARWRYRLFGPWKPRQLSRPEWETRFLP